MNEEFIKSLYASIVEDNVSIYKGLFSRENSENTIDYWKNARELYREFNTSQQEVFFTIIKTVITDTISNIFGVIDGACALDANDWNFKMSINGQNTNDELQDSFLEYVESHEDAG